MVEFSLPANSKIKGGSTHNAGSGIKNLRRFLIYRYDPDSGENPRYGRPGRVPGSVNVPAVSLFNPVDKTFLPLKDLQETFDFVGAQRDQRIIIYCGGGIAATLDAFLLYQLGYENLTVYDDSMSQWATDESFPIETD